MADEVFLHILCIASRICFIVFHRAWEGVVMGMFVIVAVAKKL